MMRYPFHSIVLVFGVLLLGICSSVFAQGETFPPEPLPGDHFAAMMSRSPFVLPTFEEAPQAAPGWAEDYRIVSIIQTVGELPVIMVVENSSQERFSIREEVNRRGFKLVSFQGSSDPREVSAVISRNGQEGTIRYADSILSSLPRSLARDNPAIRSE